MWSHGMSILSCPMVVQIQKEKLSSMSTRMDITSKSQCFLKVCRYFVLLIYYFKNISHKSMCIFFGFSFHVNNALFLILYCFGFLPVRNTINTIYSSQQIQDKIETRSSDESYPMIMRTFEALGTKENVTTRSNHRLSWTTFCFVFAAGVGLVVVYILKFFYFCS